MLQQLLKRFFLMSQKYLPINTVAELNEVEPHTIMNLYYKNKKDERFKTIDNQLCVLQDYQYPYAIELDKLRNIALVIASNENNLCVELANMSGENYQTFRKYFYRFTFKQVNTAKHMMNLLNSFINSNSLFPIKELSNE